jgi:DNA repair protein RecO (recombination protein O)
LKQKRDEAHVLRTQELGEADLIVTLLTEWHGMVRGVAPHARKSRKRFGGSLEPLTHVQAAWVEKAGRELHRMEALECRRSFAEMQADPLRQAACAVLSEISEAFAREGEADSKAFRLLGAALAALEDGADPWVVVRYFEFWTLRLHGLLPDLDRCGGCAEPLAGKDALRVVARRGLLCRNCLAASGEPGRRLSADERNFIDRARETPPSGMGERSSVARPGGALEALLRGTLESFAERKFKAYRHMNWSERA